MEPRQGKVTVILLAVVAVVSLAATGAAVTLQMKERTLRETRERELKLVTAQNQELEQQLRDLEVAKEQIEDDLARAKSQLQDSLEQLASERKAKEELAKSIDDRQEEIARLTKDLKQIETERTSLSEQTSSLKSQHDAMLRQLADLQQAKQDLETKVLELSGRQTMELEKVVVTNGSDGQTAESAAPSGTPAYTTASVQTTGAGLQGQVIVVNREYDFVVVNLGKNQGLSVGQEFQITRDDEILGRVKVEKIYDELSAAAILPESKKESIREGDSVRAL